MSPYVPNQQSQSEIRRKDSEDGHFRTTNRHLPGPEFPYVSDDEIAKMIAESDRIEKMAAETDEAMAELERMYEPFLNPPPVPQGLPTMDLSAASAKDTGFMFPTQAARDNEYAMPNSERTGQDQSVTHGFAPLISDRQRAKRKERDDAVESFQHVQLDVERQDPRPAKRVKSVHGVNNGVRHINAAYGFQQQPQVFPSHGGYQLPYSHAQNFGGPALQGAPPPQQTSVGDADLYNGSGSYRLQNGGITGQYPNAVFDSYQTQNYPPTSFGTFGTAFPDQQQSMGPPYMHAPAMRDGIANYVSPDTLLGDPVGNFSNWDIQAGQSLGQVSYTSPQSHNMQPATHQPAMPQSGSRANHGNGREP